MHAYYRYAEGSIPFHVARYARMPDTAREPAPASAAVSAFCHNLCGCAWQGPLSPCSFAHPFPLSACPPALPCRPRRPRARQSIMPRQSSTCRRSRAPGRRYCLVRGAAAASPAGAAAAAGPHDPWAHRSTARRSTRWPPRHLAAPQPLLCRCRLRMPRAFAAAAARVPRPFGPLLRTRPPSPSPVTATRCTGTTQHKPLP